MSSLTPYEFATKATEYFGYPHKHTSVNGSYDMLVEMGAVLLLQEEGPPIYNQSIVKNFLASTFFYWILMHSQFEAKLWNIAFTPNNWESFVCKITFVHGKQTKREITKEHNLYDSFSDLFKVLGDERYR